MIEIRSNEDEDPQPKDRTNHGGAIKLHRRKRKKKLE